MTKNPIPLTVRGLRAECKSKQEIFLFSSNGIFLYSQTLKVKKKTVTVMTRDFLNTKLGYCITKPRFIVNPNQICIFKI